MERQRLQEEIMTGSADISVREVKIIEKYDLYVQTQNKHSPSDEFHSDF